MAGRLSLESNGGRGMHDNLKQLCQNVVQLGSFGVSDLWKAYNPTRLSNATSKSPYTLRHYIHTLR